MKPVTEFTPQDYDDLVLPSSTMIWSGAAHGSSMDAGCYGRFWKKQSELSRTRSWATVEGTQVSG